MKILPNETHITLPRAVTVDGMSCNVLSYNYKRREATLSDGRFIGLSWAMEPEQWEAERAGWLARGAQIGANVFYNSEHGRLHGAWGWIMTA